jgi:hypothetical protein
MVTTQNNEMKMPAALVMILSLLIVVCPLLDALDSLTSNRSTEPFLGTPFARKPEARACHDPSLNIEQ